MEVGAVKQAFNNEVILLKKKVNQAKVQIIHKLTRKAKVLTEKKAPEHLKEKLKKKAESAVKEVLIIKKIKARDIAKFMVTHTGEVKDYLNKPSVDNDKACARLILSKALQEKYKFFRNRFGNVPIKDLFMSRQERRKLKKEARVEQKNKKGKGKVVNAEGDWDVDDIDTKMNVDNGDSMNIDDNDSLDDVDSNQGSNKIGSDSDDVAESDNELGTEQIGKTFGMNKEHSESENDDNESGKELESEKENSEEEKNLTEEEEKNLTEEEKNITEEEDDDDEQTVGKFVKLKPQTQTVVDKPKPQQVKIKNVTLPKKVITKPKLNTNKDKKVKENKNKNLNEKLQNRKFKKDLDIHTEGQKVVDPFFITASGGNYLSLAEPRQPDEIKEIHRQGNRKERRAAMFGHYVPKHRKHDGQNNFNKDNGHFNDRFGNKNDRFNDKFNNKNDRFNNNGKFNNRDANFDSTNTKFNKFSNTNKFNDKNTSYNDKFNKNDNKVKDEKLHPSWEAKKKLSSMLPFQGKKIVFNES